MTDTPRVPRQSDDSVHVNRDKLAPATDKRYASCCSACRKWGETHGLCARPDHQAAAEAATGIVALELVAERRGESSCLIRGARRMLTLRANAWLGSWLDLTIGRSV
jgi:hypothetical protein